MEHLASILAAGQIAAAIAILGGLFVPIGQGNIAAKAVESVARQPEARSSVQTTLFIGCALAETNGIYGLLMSIIILFVNPLGSWFINNIGSLPG